MEDLLAPVSGADVRDLIYGDGEELAVDGYDGDAHLDAAARHKRMAACVRASHGWLDAHAGSGLESIVSSLRMQPGGDRLTPDEALSSLVFAGVMACYSSVDVEREDKLYLGHRLSSDEEEEFFSPTASPWRPSREQYELLEQVMREEAQLRAVGPEGVDVLSAPGMGMSPTMQVIYLLIVLATLTSAALWAMHRLFNSRYINPPQRERTAKAARKVEKSRKHSMKGKLT
mmetsp:Transcript_57615/g.136988  ORF Transcript_57615/g.136988 Transcript_57615/m.136988 type:complete len:230 (-) Transcript_57615:19-708(-)